MRLVQDGREMALSHGPLRCAGVAAVVVLWTTVGLGMFRTGLELTGDRPISYLGSDSRTVMLFRGGLLVATILLVGFGWAVHRLLARRTGFLVMFLVGMAGQAVVATVSIAGDPPSHTVHSAGGIVLGLSLPVFMWRFAAGQPRGDWRRRSYGLMWLEVAACVVGVILSQSRRAVVAELAPALVFHLWIVVVTQRWPAWSDPFAGSRPR